MDNPFRPGAGHMPPYLAGRDEETNEFKELLKQKVILQNIIITGLRGIGKTVLMESFKPVANSHGWLWTGTDCSEAVSVDEDAMSLRIITDVALMTSGIIVEQKTALQIGFQIADPIQETIKLDFNYLVNYYGQVPGLASDKLKATLEMVWYYLKEYENIKGIIFAYDEAQTLEDHPKERHYPLSLMLDVFQSLQKKGIPFMMLLTGLPMLLANLVETRTYSERLFRVLQLDRLDREDSKEAILKPIKESKGIILDAKSIDLIIDHAGGYPYFIQYICKEVYDIFATKKQQNLPLEIPITAILQKLDTDFFAGRWVKATEREQELLMIIANSSDGEFRVNEVVDWGKSQLIYKPFERSQVSQMFKRLGKLGLVYRNNYGSYSFAVPLLEKFIRRFYEKKNKLKESISI